MRWGVIEATAGLAAGIAVSHLASLHWSWGLGAIVISVCIYFLLLKTTGNPIKSIRLGKWHHAWVILLFIGIGISDESLNHPVPIQEDTFTGEIHDIRTINSGDMVDILVDDTNGATIRVFTTTTNLQIGDIVHVAQPKSQTSPTNSKLPTQDNYKYTLIYKHSTIHYLGHRESLHSWSCRIRDHIESNIERSHLKPSTARFLDAMLMGDRRGLDDQTRLTFAQGGTAHILALSGLHLGILAGLILTLMWPLKAAGFYKAGYALAILALWGYVIVTGMSPSSVRACVMLTMTFLAIIFERQNSAGHALCCAIMLILLFSPSSLFNAGFQLSVVCVGALIGYAGPLNPIGHRSHPVLYKICAAVIATIVATAASWVLTSYWFGQIPTLFLPTNLVLLPLLPFYLWIAAVFVVFLTAGVELTWLGYVLDKGYDFMLWGADFFSGGTDCVIDWRIPLPLALCWLILLAAGAFLLNRTHTKSHAT